MTTRRESVARGIARAKANATQWEAMPPAQRAQWTPAPAPWVPSTTAELAAKGQVIGTNEDVLLVVAHLRCAHQRDLIGAVLYLDRSRRGEAPLLLAELCQAGIATGRGVSEASAAATATTGARLAEIDAVVLDESTRAAAACADCPGHLDRLHVVDVAALADAGMRGYRRIRSAAVDGRRPRPVVVESDRVEPRWPRCVVDAIRDDPDGARASVT